MTYKINDTNFASNTCSSCDMARGNNTDITIYYGIANHHVWVFDRFGSTNLAIGLYACSFAWVLCVIFMHHIANKVCATENGAVHPTSDVLMLAVRPSTQTDPPVIPVIQVIPCEIRVIDDIKGYITPISKLAIGQFIGTEKDLGQHAIVIIVNP